MKRRLTSPEKEPYNTTTSEYSCNPSPMYLLSFIKLTVYARVKRIARSFKGHVYNMQTDFNNRLYETLI